MKPVIRWTIGLVSDFGFSSLKKSIESFRSIYKNEFDYFLCYNSLDKRHFDMISDLEVQMVEQKPCADMFDPLGVAWKLYPPRLRLCSHELFIDNDLIILRRIKEIDDFLSSGNLFLYSESRLDRPYGEYESEVASELKMNSGFFGIPPEFDFEKEIKKKMAESLHDKWVQNFDEQGLVASIFSSQKRLKKISLNDIFICGPGLKKSEFLFGRNGYHFVKLNSGFSKYWDMYNRGRIF